MAAIAAITLSCWCWRNSALPRRGPAPSPCRRRQSRHVRAGGTCKLQGHPRGRQAICR